MNALNIFSLKSFYKLDIRILIESEVSIIKRPVYFMKVLYFAETTGNIMLFYLVAVGNIK